MDDDKKEEMAIKAGLLIVQKELEEKTGKTHPQSKDKGTIKQEDLLKRIKDEKKKKKSELPVELFTLKRSARYTDDINPETVIEIVKEKMWESPRETNLMLISGVANMVNGDFSKAEVEFKKLSNAIDKKNEYDLLYNLAELYLRTGRIREAFEHITILLRKDKEDIDAVYLAGLIFFMMNNREQAVNFVAQALKIDKEFARVHLNFAFLSFLKKNVLKAKEILEKALERDVKNMPERITKEYIHLYLKEGEKYLSEEKISDAIMQDKENVFTPCIFVNKAVYSFYFEKMIPKAEAQLGMARIKNPKCICSVIEKTRILIELEKYEDAYHELKKGMALNPLSLLVMGELLVVTSLMKMENEIAEIVAKILELDKEAVIRFYNEEGTIARVELSKIKDRFSANIALLMSNYSLHQPKYELENEEEMMIYKLMRNLKICEAKCIVTKQ